MCLKCNASDGYCIECLVANTVKGIVAGVEEFNKKEFPNGKYKIVAHVPTYIDFETQQNDTIINFRLMIADNVLKI